MAWSLTPSAGPLLHTPLMAKSIHMGSTTSHAETLLCLQPPPSDQALTHAPPLLGHHAPPPLPQTLFTCLRLAETSLPPGQAPPRSPASARPHLRTTTVWQWNTHVPLCMQWRQTATPRGQSPSERFPFAAQSLALHCPIQHSVMLEVVCVYTGQHGSYYPMWPWTI